MLHKHLELHLPSSSFHYLQKVLFSDGVLKNTNWILFLSLVLIFTVNKEAQLNGNECLFHNPPTTAGFIIYEEYRDEFCNLTSACFQFPSIQYSHATV